MTSRKTLVCVFAHPDDEAFGPAGTIAKWAEKADVYLICVTDGSNPNAHIDGLKNIRNEELKESARILGVKDIIFLNYTDGSLSNNIYHEVAGKIEEILINFLPTKLMTFEERGGSGHIDHIFVSMVTTYLFNKLSFVKSLYYWAMPKYFSDHMKDYFIYCPEGCESVEADYIENIASVWDKKIDAIKTHTSQKHDGDFVLEMIEHHPKEEYFFVKKKI